MFFSRNENSKVNKPRLIFLIIFIFSILVIYVGYLFHLQIKNNLVYQNMAVQVSSRSVVVPAQRGKIYDRFYDLPLAQNLETFSLKITPALVVDNDFTALYHKLTDLLDLNYEVISKSIAPISYNQYNPVEVYSGLSYEDVVKLSENIDDFPSVSWAIKSIRDYPDIASLSHVVGYVGDISQEDLQVLYNEGYNSNSVIGRTGIEKQYDNLLRGTDGRSYRTVDVRGRGIEDNLQYNVAPQHGDNIVLTIDSDIQRLAERALGNRVGSVVVLKPTTGEVLAMVSKPYYNPNLFYTEEAGRAFSMLSQDRDFPFLNRTVQVLYPPASLFKTVMASAIVEEELFPLDSEIMCEGTVFFGDRHFNCHMLSGHGPLDLLGAYKESCDIYFYTVGRDHVGIDRIAEYSDYYGFGKQTGIDLPSEVTGNVPTRIWKEQTYNTPWTGGDTMNTSIGQGFLLVTPLQIADMVAGVVNKGIIYKPHLLYEVRNQTTGDLIQRTEPEILSSIPLKEETFDFVQEAMRAVCVDGTARFLITTDAVEVAGKTGTGEIGVDGEYHSWFASYAPYETENPDERLVVVVLVDASEEYEGWAPIASNIILNGIFKDKTYEESVYDLNLWFLREPEPE